MMKNCYQSIEINHNSNWPYIPNHRYRIFIIGGSGLEKTNVLLTLIKDKNGRQKLGMENLRNPKALLKKKRVLILFDDMIADMKSNKKLRPKSRNSF